MLLGAIFSKGTFMPTKKFFAASLCVLAGISLTVLAADKDKKETAKEPPKPSYELPQPATETLDYGAYSLIRTEALSRSHVMEYASALTDGIGSRMTGSPNLKKANEWTRDQLTAMGCANAHLEDWGEFGMGWQQLNTWVRMSSPDTAVFIAQAAPWSASSNGAIEGPAVSINAKKAEDLDKYKGKVTGKIVLFGEMREVKPVDKPLFERYDDKELANLVEYPLTLNREYEEYVKTYAQRRELYAKAKEFLVSEHALAVILPSRDGRNGGGSGGTIFDDRNLGAASYQREHAVPFPVVTMAIENYGRVYRLLEAHVPVTMR